MDLQKREDIWVYFEKQFKSKDLLDDFKKRIKLIDLKKFLLLQHPLFGLSEEEVAAVTAYKDKACDEMACGKMTIDEFHDNLCKIGGEFDNFITDARGGQAQLKDNPFSGLSEVELDRILLHRNQACATKTKEEIDDFACGQGY